ncbi:hypothetical protein BDI4_1220023 [Burkholderia diffusa]|nr:hypothetical protein BDI4_1220023 [Burkholderia diffusa]
MRDAAFDATVPEQDDSMVGLTLAQAVAI